MKPAKKGTQKSPESTAATGKKPKGFTDEERVAMRERLQELKADARRGRRAHEESGELSRNWTPPQRRIVGRDEVFPPEENAHHRARTSPSPTCARWYPRNSGAQDIEFGVDQFVAARKECARRNFACCDDS